MTDPLAARAIRGSMGPPARLPGHLSAGLLALALALAFLRPAAAAAAEHLPGQASFRLPASADKAMIETWIREASRRHGLEASLIRAVMEVESGADAGAVSPKGAQGLMQIMPGTARDLKLSNPFDPMENIDAGSRYLAVQLKAFGDIRLALAAYNAGPEAVRKHAGIPPYPETQRYVEACANRYIRLKTGGDVKALVRKALEGR